MLRANPIGHAVALFRRTAVTAFSSRTLLLLLTWLLATSSFTAFAQATQPNIQYNNKAVDLGDRNELRVNPSTRALEIQIPLGNYPGRAGADVPITLSYSSKLWRLDYSFFRPSSVSSSGAPVNDGYTAVIAKYGEHSSAGWTSNISFPTFDTAPIQYYDIDGKPEGTGSCRHCYTIDRLLVWMPDGGSHELRSTDQPRPPGSPVLDDLHAVDGSRLRYQRSTQTLFMPNGSRYLFATRQYVDRNGNILTYTGGGLTDTLGRTISAPPLTSKVGKIPGSYPYSLPGISGSYTFVWKTLSSPGVLTTPAQLRHMADSRCPPSPLYSPWLFQSDLSSTRTCILNADEVFNPVVLYQIQLPTGQAYTFTYNVYGEIDKIQLPTGGYERYQYQQGGGVTSTNHPYLQTVRGVADRFVSASGTGDDEVAWHYSGSFGLISITSPDNTLVERYQHTDSMTTAWGYSTDGARAGMPYDERYYSAPDAGNVRRMLRRKLTEWSVTPSNAVGLTGVQHANRNARVAKEVELMLDTGGDALARVTTYGYDLTHQYTTGVNQKSASYFDHVAVPQATAKSGGMNSMPSPSQPLRVIETAYLDDNSSYRLLNILGLPTSIIFKNAAGTPEAKTTVSYDEPNYQFVNNYGAVTAWAPPEPARGNVTTVRRFVAAAATVPSTQTCPAGVCFDTHVKYDQCGSPVASWDANGNIAQTAYSGTYAYAYPTSLTSAAPDPGNTGYGSASGLVTTNVYDLNTGRLTSTTDPNDKVTTFEYNDPLGRTTGQVRPDLGRTTIEHHDGAGDLYVSVFSDIDATRRTETRCYYDGLGRAVRSFNRENQDLSNPWLTTDVQYDSMGRAYKVSNPYRSATASLGTPGTINPSGHWTQKTFDALGRIIEVMTTADNAKITTAFDGNKVFTTDQAGRRKVSCADALGQLRDVWELTPTDPATETVEFLDADYSAYHTAYDFDALGNLRTVTQAAGAQGSQTRTFLYDGLGRLTSATNPESGQVGYTYDNNGNLQTKTDARGVTTTYEYDGLNRNTRVRYTDAVLGPNNHTKDVDRHYDGAINGKGRLSYFNWDPADNTKYDTHLAIDQYDAAGRPEKYRQHFFTAGVASPPFTITRTYDKAGNVTSQTYPSGHTVTYNYDAAGRLGDNGALAAFAGNLGDGVQRTYASAITYSEFDGIREERFGTHTPLYHKQHYNVRGQRYSVRLSTLSLASNEFDWNRGSIVNYYDGAYTWGGAPGSTGSGHDNNGNLRRVETFIPANDQLSAFSAIRDDYEYDALNRLKWVAESRYSDWSGQTIPSFKQAYDYDRWGNRTIDAGETQVYGQNPGYSIPEPQFELSPPTNREVPEPSNRLYAPGDMNRVPSLKLMRYDEAGNLIHDEYTGKGGRTYDAENRMTSAAIDAQGNRAYYAYDADGRRVRRKIVNEEWWQVYGIDGELVAEYRAGAAPYLPSKEYGYRSGKLLVTISSGDDQRLRRFVQALYYGALRAEPQPADLQDKVNQLATAGAQGQAQLRQKAKEVARALFVQTAYETSPYRSDTQYVTDLYYAYLHRAPDTPGLNHWMAAAAGGAANRSNVCDAFQESPEFSALVATLYGEATSDDQRTDRFIHVFHLGATGMIASTADLLEKRAQLNAAAAQGPEAVKAQAEAMGRSLFAAQVNDLSLPAQQFVTNLYESFLQRGPDANGLAWWTAQAGTTVQGRQSVLNAFASCDPFRELAGTLYRETFWLVSDHLGTPRMVADRTGSLAGIRRHDYLPFGEELPSSTAGGRAPEQGYGRFDGSRKKWSQLERDDETQLDYAQARYYSPSLGRFTGVDPQNTQAMGDLNAPQSWNAYAYVNNNPLRRVDPKGEDWSWEKFKNLLSGNGWATNAEVEAAAQAREAKDRAYLFERSERVGYSGFVFVQSGNDAPQAVPIDSLSRSQVSQIAAVFRMEEAGINTGRVENLSKDAADTLMQNVHGPVGNTTPRKPDDLKPTHGVNEGGLEYFRKMSTREIIESLKPGKREALRARPDGTLLNGHHRIKVLQERGIDVNSLPREIIPKEPLGPLP